VYYSFSNVFLIIQNQSDTSWHLHHLLYESEATLKDYTQVNIFFQILKSFIEMFQLYIFSIVFQTIGITSVLILF
jgi:hypothetical protein